jgi:hypothetical protein
VVFAALRSAGASRGGGASASEARPEPLAEGREVLGLRVWDSGFRAWGVVLGAQYLRIGDCARRVWGAQFRVQGSGSRVRGVLVYESCRKSHQEGTKDRQEKAARVCLPCHRQHTSHTRRCGAVLMARRETGGGSRFVGTYPFPASVRVPAPSVRPARVPTAPRAKSALSKKKTKKSSLGASRLRTSGKCIQSQVVSCSFASGQVDALLWWQKRKHVAK